LDFILPLGKILVQRKSSLKKILVRRGAGRKEGSESREGLVRESPV